METLSQKIKHRQTKREQLDTEGIWKVEMNTYFIYIIMKLSKNNIKEKLNYILTLMNVYQ